MKKIALSWILSVLGLVALLAVLGTHLVPEDGLGGRGQALVNGAFTLQSGDGKTVTEKDFAGRYMLVYFGYTHCPDICPTALLLMENAVNRLPMAARIQPIFITVDPARDTPKIASEYANHFGKDMIGLGGTDAQIKQTADNYKVYYRKVDDQNTALGYVMDHSGFIYLMGPDASYITHFPHNVSERELEDGLRKFVR